MHKLIIITGQTATGKTKLALKLAKKNNGELVNCDSRQIYKGLDIITGKDLPKISNLKTHSSKLNFKIWKKLNKFDIGHYSLRSKIWLYDIVSPKQYFSSYDWVQCVHKVIEDIHGRGKIPIIVGGTYFYLKHLLYGFETENIPPNWKLRKELNHKPTSELQMMFKTLDLQSFNRLNNSDKNNPQRLIRKIEIALTTVKYLTVRKENNFIYSITGLRFRSKEKLAQAITKRVEERIENGAIEEVKILLKEGYSETDPGLKTIGYQQIMRYLKSLSSFENAKKEWITRELQYAKRQYTFMKKDKNIKWLYS